MSKHEFAFYIPTLSSYKETTFTLDDQVVVHRMQHVLRLQKGTECILFDRHEHAQVVIETLTKKSVTVRVLHKDLNVILQPSITFLLPLLKRDALEDALYACVELGANQVQLVLTEKMQRSWKPKEFDRLERVMIAAAEQSKNFAFPDLLAPRPLQDILHQKASTTLFFDSQGSPINTVLPSLPNNQEVRLLVGPEGDLTSQEKALLSERDVTFCRLTPTILRARQAVSLGLGVIRSWLSS